MSETTRIVGRPRNDPPRLRVLASRRRMAPLEFLVDVVSRHPTYEAAAAECGVSRPTFLAWRNRYGVRGVVTDGPIEGDASAVLAVPGQVGERAGIPRPSGAGKPGRVLDKGAVRVPAGGSQ